MGGVVGVASERASCGVGLSQELPYDEFTACALWRKRAVPGGEPGHDEEGPT